MNAKSLSFVAVAVVAIIAICAAFVIMNGNDGGDGGDDVPSKPSKDPMDTKLADLPIGSKMKWEVSGSYTTNGIVYDIVGEETYEVISKDSKNISFKVNGTHYAVYGSQKFVMSKQNGDIKTWDLTDDHTPCEVGELSTVFGVQKVKIVDWILPETSAGYKITNLGSKQYWGYDNGFGLIQKMAYSIDSVGEVIMETKALVSVEIR